VKRRKTEFQSIKDLLGKYDWDKKRYITREFQDYGLRLAQELSDEKHKSLYIKLAKNTEREILEEARMFVKDAYRVKNKARLFMWKIKELKAQTPALSAGRPSLSVGKLTSPAGRSNAPKT